MDTGDPVSDVERTSTSQEGETDDPSEIENALRPAATFVRSADYIVPATVANFYSHSPRERVVEGLIGEHELARALQVFVQPAGYLRMIDRLARDRVVVLVGTAGTGRRTTALNLLQACHATEIRALGRSTGLTDLQDDAFRPGCGYLLESPSLLTDDGTVDEVHFRRLVDGVRGKGAYLVMTTDENHARIGGAEGHYTHRCPPPDPLRVVEEHLSVYMDPEKFAQRRDTLLGDQTRKALAASDNGTAPPSLCDALAKALCEVADPVRDIDEALAILDGHTRENTISWLANVTDPAVLALAIALAVFEHTDSTAISAAATRLQNTLWPEAFPLAPPAAKPDLRDQRLEAVNAREDNAFVRTRNGEGQYPVKTARFSSPAWRDALLDVVWEQYEQLRPAILDWLADTPADLGLHLLAGAVAGRFITSWSGYEALERVVDWAGDEHARIRVMAAEALASAADNPDLEPIVRQRVSRWGQHNTNRRLQWTAAVTFGSRYGRQRPAMALRQLGNIAAGDAGLRGIVTASTVGLFAERDLRRQVIDALCEWLTGASVALRDIGADVAMQLISRTDAEPWAGTPWCPSLLAFDDHGDASTARLLRVLLRTPQHSGLVVLALINWSQRRERNRMLDGQLTAVLTALHDDDTDRQRLRFEFSRAAFQQPSLRDIPHFRDLLDRGGIELEI